MLTSSWFIFQSELRLYARNLQQGFYPIAFFLIIICLFSISFSGEMALLQKMLPAIIWIAALLASMLSVATIFSFDQEDGHLEQLLLSSLPLTLQIHLKLLADWLVTELPIVLFAPLVGAIFHMNSSLCFALFFSLLLGTPILLLLGTLGVALTLGLKQHGTLLSFLILPLAVPVLIVGINLVEEVAVGIAPQASLAFLAALTTLAITLLPWTIAQSLRVTMEG